jgi:cell division protein FtsQ
LTRRDRDQQMTLEEGAAGVRTNKRRRGFRSYWLPCLGAMALGVGGLLAFQRTEEFLIRDARFALAPPEFGAEAGNIEIHGVSRVSRADVVRVFERDFARSLYLLPLAERRRNLLAVDWVKDASVSRIWPNRVAVRITERAPVAFAALPSEAGMLRFTLIDADGVLLEPRRPGSYSLPVLVGVRREHNETARRDRVHRMLRLLEDIGELSKNISEIDVSEPDNIKVRQKMSDRAVVLMLGNQRFRQRLQNFISHYADIRRRLPGATVLDLRLENRITAAGGSS